MHGQLSFKRMQNHTVDRPVTPADPVPGGLVSDFNPNDNRWNSLAPAKTRRGAVVDRDDEHPTPPSAQNRELLSCGYWRVLLAGCRSVIRITGRPPGPSAHSPHGPPSSLTPSRSSVPSMARAGW